MIKATLLWLPIPMACLGMMTHGYPGPRATMIVCHKVSNFILRHVAPCKSRIKPEDIDMYMKFVNRVSPHRLMACFETACALEIWLAFHGQEVRVCVGKRVENGELLVHAWLEPDGFLKDERFEELRSTAQAKA